MQENQRNSPVNFNEGTINIREEIEKYVYHWKWFVLSTFLALTIVFIYLRYTPNLYEASATILIEDVENSELSAFKDLGLVGNSQASLENEIELLKSRNLIQRVAKELQLNVSYYNQGRVIEAEFFHSGSPFNINFLISDSVFDELYTTFSIIIKSKTHIILKTTLEEKEFAFGEKISLSFGDIVITPKDVNRLKVNDETIIKIIPLRSVAESYRNRIQVEVVKNSSVIRLSLRDRVNEKAQEILDNLIKQYNIDAVTDKSLIAKRTNEFINDRISIIDEDLSQIEAGVEEFKIQNRLTDISSEAGIALQSKNELSKQIIALSTQLKLVDYVNEYISSNTKELIPAGLGIDNSSITESISKYNELLLERNRILNSSSELHPTVINLNTQLNQFKENILQSLSNLKSSLTISLNDIKNQEIRFNSKIAAVPKQEREYRDIQRQQEIIEALYLYLLQKREENAITLAVTLPNAKIVDKAYGGGYPVAPNRRIFYLTALSIGLILPFGVLYVIFLLDNKIHTRKDVEDAINIPILGDIPQSKSEKKVVISDRDRDSTSESFRLLRTNVNFMLSSVKGNSKTIFITSTLAGEGKTFIAINLASVLALTNKKVLLIGGDIRKPKIVEYLNIKSTKKGLSHFLMDTSLNVSDVIEQFEETNFDILESGIIAPNPSELLMNGRFDEVLAYGKANYDYVIVDTAPINIVTDTLLFSQQADLFIYVIRANYLDKRLLEIPNKLYKEKRLPNMAVLINDTDLERGYGYGYGYGYGHAEKETKKNRWWRKVIPF